MAGTAKLELATFAVTAHNSRTHLNAADTTELQRKIRVKSGSPLPCPHYAAQNRIALQGVESQDYDTKYGTENNSGASWL
jgi:hypothetical protein